MWRETAWKILISLYGTTELILTLSQGTNFCGHLGWDGPWGSETNRDHGIRTQAQAHKGSYVLHWVAKYTVKLTDFYLSILCTNHVDYHANYTLNILEGHALLPLKSLLGRPKPPFGSLLGFFYFYFFLQKVFLGLFLRTTSTRTNLLR